jgi:hypothetical protein
MKSARQASPSPATLAGDAVAWEHERQRRWAVEPVPGSRGSDEVESAGLDAAYLATLQRGLGEERLEQAHREWLQALVDARPTLRTQNR